MKSIRSSLQGQGILVTGGAGFIGSHLVDRLLDIGAGPVIALDNLFLGKRSHLEEAERRGAIFVEGDAEDSKLLRNLIGRHRISNVFNLATKALPYSFIDPRDAFATNTQVILNLLELQREGAFQTLSHFSSSEVYGTARAPAIDENHPRHPTTTYAAGKAAADLALESYVEMFKLDAWIARPFNNYGPRQNWEGPLAGVIPRTIARIHQGKPPQIEGDGQQSRDFIYVGDTVEAALTLYRHVPAGESVNIASESCLEIFRVIEAVSQGMNYRGPVEKLPARPADVRRHTADIRKLQGFYQAPRMSFAEGIRKTIEWQLPRMGGVK